MGSKKILYVAPNLRVSNGVTSFLMNNYPYIRKSGFDVDFLLIQKIDSPYNAFVEEYGSEIFVYPKQNKYCFSNYRYVKEVVENGRYDYVHINTSGMWAYWALLAADRNKVRVRIYHSHNPKETTSLKGIIREELFDWLCFRHTNAYLACTDHAGKSVFGQRKFTVIKNGVDYKKFAFSEEKRKRQRKDIGVGNNIVIGTVCRQSEQKNPYFIVDILEGLCAINPAYKLVWIGTGPLLDSVKDYIHRKALDDKVIFLGDRTDVCDLYSMMDVFLLPSKYEGLGIVYMEAQANGLMCFASDAVPKDTRLTNRIKYVGLDRSPDYWAKVINGSLDNFHDDLRKDALCDVSAADSNIIITNKELIKTYKKLWEEL